MEGEGEGEEGQEEEEELEEKGGRSKKHQKDQAGWDDVSTLLLPATEVRLALSS